LVCEPADSSSRT